MGRSPAQKPPRTRQPVAQPARAGRADGDATARRILDAAGLLFATHGFAETSSKAVAQHADVSLASINYHFGSRAGLYQAALAEAHGELIALSELQLIDASRLSAAGKLGRIIDTLVAAAASERGWAARLLAREVLAPSSHLHVLWSREVQPKVSIVTRILSEASGIPPTDPALFRCLLSIIAPCLVLIVAGLGLPGPLQAVRQQSREELATHLRTFALAGLAAVTQQRARGGR